MLIAGLEVGNAESALFEVDCHKTVQIVGHVGLVQLVIPDVLVSENIAHLPHLGMKIEPLLRVVLNEHVLGGLLGND